MRSAFGRKPKPISSISTDTSHENPVQPSQEHILDRIETACLALETFPERGTRRDDLRPGLRTMGFERRATIVFQVMEREVIIVRIFYGGRDYERVLRRIARD